MQEALSLVAEIVTALSTIAAIAPGVAKLLGLEIAAFPKKGPRLWGLFWLTFAIAIGVGQFLVHGRRTQELVAESKVDPQVPITGDMPRVTQEAAPAVVRVVDGWLAVVPGESTRRFVVKSSSGFFVDPNGYIVTSANVMTGDTVDAERYGRKRLLEQIQADAESPLHGLNDNDLLWRLNKVQMKKFSYVFLPDGRPLHYEEKVSSSGIAVLKVRMDNDQNPPTLLLLADDEQVHVPDQVWAFGYNTPADEMQGLGVFDQSAPLDVAVNSGTISAKRKDTESGPLLQTTIPITEGELGSPVVNEAGKVVAIATLAASGKVSILSAASTITEVLRDAGASNQLSQTNTVYSRALDELADAEYGVAIKDLERVKRLFPSHKQASELLERALVRRDIAESRSLQWSSLVVFGLTIGFGALLVAGIFTARWLRSRELATSLVDAAQRLRLTLRTRAPTSQPVGRFHEAASAPRARPAPSAPASASSLKETRSVQADDGPVLAMLLAEHGVLSGQNFPVGPHGITVGRDPAHSQITLSDPLVSGAHVWIGLKDGKLLAIDNHSRNGTYLNDMNRGRITTAELHQGDMLIVCDRAVGEFRVLSSSVP